MGWIPGAPEERRAKLWPEILGVHDLQRLAARLEALEARVRTLEQGTRPRTASPASRPLASAGLEAPAGTAAETAALAGRIALGLGGAFALRSATQAGILTPRLGVVLGLVYGLAWLVAADRAASRLRVRQAVADAVMASLIGFPLIWEATARFHFLNLLQAWVAAAGIGFGYLIVSFRRRMPGLLWPVVVAMPPLCLALSLATGAVPAWLALLLGGAITLEWMAMRRRRFRPLATTALVLFAFCLALTTGSACLAPPLVLERTLVPWQVLSIQTAAFVLGAAPLLLRAGTRGRVHRRSAWAATIATVVGLGGALAVGHRTGSSTLAAGAAATVMGLAACIVAARIRRPAALGAPGLAVAVVGLAGLLPERWFLIGLWTLAAGAALAALARRDGPLGTWLGVQAAIAGGLVLSLSGALGFGLRALIGGEAGPPKAQVALAMVAGLACAATLPAGDGRARARSRECLLFGLLLVAAGLGVSVLSPLIPPLFRPVLRSLAMALAAVSMARVAPALVYPVLIAGGMKILVDDLRAGDTFVLVLSFSLYGLALLLAPRLLRGARPA